jgi:hypothetical protein
MGRFTYGISNKHRSEQKLPCMQGRSDSGLVLGEYKFKEALHRSSFFFVHSCSDPPQVEDYLEKSAGL